MKTILFWRDRTFQRWSKVLFIGVNNGENANYFWNIKCCYTEGCKKLCLAYLHGVKEMGRNSEVINGFFYSKPYGSILLSF